MLANKISGRSEYIKVIILQVRLERAWTVLNDEVWVLLYARIWFDTIVRGGWLWQIAFDLRELNDLNGSGFSWPIAQVFSTYSEAWSQESAACLFRITVENESCENHVIVSLISILCHILRGKIDFEYSKELSRCHFLRLLIYDRCDPVELSVFKTRVYYLVWKLDRFCHLSFKPYLREPRLLEFSDFSVKCGFYSLFQLLLMDVTLSKGLAVLVELHYLELLRTLDQQVGATVKLAETTCLCLLLLRLTWVNVLAQESWWLDLTVGVEHGPVLGCDLLSHHFLFTLLLKSTEKGVTW